MKDRELEQLFAEIRTRFTEFPKGSPQRSEISAKLKSLARLQKEPYDYRVPESVRFPEAVQVVHAVCHPECGHDVFMVDGGPQSCPRCGGTLLRDSGALYLRGQEARNGH